MGRSGLDRRMVENHANAGLHGFRRGMYALWLPYLTPIEQAQHAVNIYRQYKWELPLAGDFELAPSDGRNVGNEILAYLTHVEQELNVKPIIYTGKPFWNKYVGDVSWAKNYPLWLASYYPPDNTVHRPEDFWDGDLPIGFDQWSIWQFSSTMKGSEWGVQSAGLDMNWMRV